jgi:hypothetical protein
LHVVDLAAAGWCATADAGLVSCDHRDPLPTRRLTAGATRIQHRPIPRHHHVGDLGVTAEHLCGGLADRPIPSNRA